MQTPQTNQAINQFTPKTIFFNFCEIWAVTIQHHQQGISSRDPGRSGGEEGREKRVDDLQHHQQGTLLHVDIELPSRNFSQRDDIVGKTKLSVTRGRTIAKTRSKDSVFDAKGGMAMDDPDGS